MTQTLILGFNDNTDGKAYLEEKHYCHLDNALETAVLLSERCDHVLAMKETTYEITPHDYLSLKANAIEFYGCAHH